MSSTVLHVVGAGLAGLSCAVAAASVGARTIVYEAAPQAGGRCRSFYDAHLDAIIDNGSHLLLEANTNVCGYLRRIGGLDATHQGNAEYGLHDLRTGETKRITPFHPGTGFAETFRALGIPFIPDNQTVRDRLSASPSYASAFQPLCWAILNTPADIASAKLFAAVLRKIFLGGRQAMRPRLFPRGLSAALISPAETYLRNHGSEILFNRRLTDIRSSHLAFGAERIELTPQDRVVLALPPHALAKILPEYDGFDIESILNIHFKHPPARADQNPIGLIGGAAHWLFFRDGIVSATVSTTRESKGVTAERIWQEISGLVGGRPSPLPPHRIIREKRATLRHSPAIHARRPFAETAYPGVFLAGDWLASPWPCTMESAVSSGLIAAEKALERDDLRFP